MAKRYGAKQRRPRRRTLSARRSRFLERIRVFTIAKFTSAFIIDSDPSRDQFGRDEHGHRNAEGSTTTAAARAFFGRVLQQDAEWDPELYVLSPITEPSDCEDEF